MRCIGEQELDPLGADAGTFATSVPPTETAIVSYGDSYNPAHPNFSYTVDGIRVPVESFVAFLGVKLHDPLGLLEDWARASSKPIAYRNVGVRWGEKYDVMYDANYNLVSNASIYDPALRGVSFGVEYAIYSDAELDLTLLPQKPVPRSVPDPTDGSETLIGERAKVAHAAIDAAEERLKKFTDCLDFIKGNSGLNPLEVLDALQRGNGIRYKEYVSGSGETPQLGGAPGHIKVGGLGSSDTIFLGNRFFNGPVAHVVPGSTRALDEFRWQQEVILHELRHALLGTHPAGGTSDDYNRGIREHCFGADEFSQ